MVWDKGWYEPAADVPVDRQLARGKIDIVRHGRKLRGGFTLINTGTRSAGAAQSKNWLLIKHRDEYADSSWAIESPALSRSVLTGRTLEAIATGEAPRAISRRPMARGSQ